MAIYNEGDQSRKSCDDYDHEYDYSVKLSELDIQAVDELVACGFDTDKVSESVRERARRITNLLGVIDHYQLEQSKTGDSDSLSLAFSSSDSDDLCDRTMSYIHQHDQNKSSRPFEAPAKLSKTAIIGAATTGFDANIGWQDMDDNPRQFTFERFNLRDVIGIAASIILLIGVVSPILAGARAEARKQSCRSNMMGAGIGFSAYAADYQYALPVADVVDETGAGGNWIASRANSANLFRLAKTGYSSLATLCCPGNSKAGKCESLLASENWPDRESTSFSYQNLIASDRRAKWGDDGRIMVILSDRSPFIETGPCGKRPCSVDANSECHGPEGQNVLVSDGSGIWLTQATFNGDNIWLPENLQKNCRNGNDASGVHTVITLSGDEVPDHQWDTMLVQ